MRAPNPYNLPAEAYAVHVCDETEVVKIRFGSDGYLPIQKCDNPIQATALAAALNFREGVTTEEAQAMVAGSMFGWDVPGCNPKLYRKAN